MQIIDFLIGYVKNEKKIISEINNILNINFDFEDFKKYIKHNRIDDIENTCYFHKKVFTNNLIDNIQKDIIQHI